MSKTILKLILILIMTKQNSKAQEFSKNYPLEKDISTIDGIIKAFYEVVSGEAGEKRQWERDLSIHNPSAIYSYLENINGELQQVTMSLKDFHKETDAMIMETAFYESEINREVRMFGNIAQVWSTYETRLLKDGPVARRGINSIQLFFDKGKWSIVSLIFEREGAEKIPKTFDPN
ncbi:hypothetical protein [Flavobacterium psychrophilum]|uniref:hypothetical protein n=1 Tax=Flavobacterium psychrophilum TaxID=96345 RepID=UPI00076E7A31|nr:hypothetical protein [Flavobacterium psychrophilum]MCB6060388.1 hypothetical protein [Flavobacterium psychrophilum]SNB97393.1 conserved hypothetical protein [Flavobacterium psychrophilum]GAQ47876.1 hypothetical protein FPK15_contig00002-0042 [Flavobacterium psychrophilum]GAW88286.1 hypothetical protein FPS14_contig00003-0051 [Flavobacterium psychrophilum]GEJ30073.1 hypothetical protein FPN185_contig00042-0041 [Flavobacterium psychrophilum]